MAREYIQFDSHAKRSYHHFNDSFLNFDDASSFIEARIMEYKRNYPNYIIVECRVVLLAGRWSAGIAFTEGQTEMEI